LIFADQSTTGDGIVSALQVLRILRESAAGLADLAAVMREYPSRLQAIPVSSKPPLESVPGLGHLMAEATEVFGDSGRHLIRYSGTENKIRVLVEHREADVCDHWLERFGALIRSEMG
jgi:phosphoglucosamine mutase